MIPLLLLSFLYMPLKDTSLPKAIKVRSQDGITMFTIPGHATGNVRGTNFDSIDWLAPLLRTGKIKLDSIKEVWFLDPLNYVHRTNNIVSIAFDPAFQKWVVTSDTARYINGTSADGTIWGDYIFDLHWYFIKIKGSDKILMNTNP